MRLVIMIIMLVGKMVLLTMLMALTVSNRLYKNDPLNATRILESREDMMFRYRLPNNTIPRLYRIIIEPHMVDNFRWNGESSIDIEVLKITKILTLHAYKNLVMDENFTELVDIDGKSYKPIGHNRDDELEFLKISFDRDILVGNYSLILKYEGEDTQGIQGFYRIFHPEYHSWVAATHFEATTARRAFPCWDEPGLKARFQMSIKHDPNYTVISNMPEIKRIETTDAKILTSFDTTPVMSVYLLTFVLCDCSSISNEHGNVTIWAQKNVLNEVQYVLNMSQRVVDVMESYTGLPFGFPRVGSVLVSNYFAAATEHWGLVTYSEELMRFNRTTGTTMQFDRKKLLTAHELSHSWFGNRVSPMWWNDLWLNEAFAAYFEYQIMDRIYDNWGGSELFVVRNIMRTAFFADDYDDNVYIRWTPVTNLEIRRLFGPITYRKGAAIVHMFRNVLTEDVFRAGIQKYLTILSYEAAEAIDLTRAFQEAYDENDNVIAPLNVNNTMMGWLHQTGYPMINVTRNYTTGDTKVTQRSVLTGESTNKRWSIPLNYATKTNANFSSTIPTSWISDEEDGVTIGGIDKDDWVIFNIQASGYYRVNYDDENWKRLVEYLNTDDYKNIHVLNRAQLISDSNYLAQREPSRYRKLFWQLTKYLSREIDYVPWYIAMFALESLDQQLSGSEIYETFQKHILGLMNNLIEKVGFETFDDDDHMTKLSKEEVVAWACLSGHSGCAEFSARRLLRLIENPVDNRLHPDNRLPIFCAGLGRLNDTAARKIVEWALVNDEPLLLRNLGCTENHEIHRNFLLRAIQENSTDDYYSYGIFGDILKGSDENFNFAIDFVVENHEAMKNLFGENDWLEQILRTISPVVTTKARLEKFKRILELDASPKNDSETLKSAWLNVAGEYVAQKDELVADFRQLWDTQLTSENTITDDVI